MKVRPALELGRRVYFEGAEHVVVTLDATSAGLRSQSGQARAVLLEFLFSAPDFAMPDADIHRDSVGKLAAMPADVMASALAWERHVIEAETGRSPDRLAGSPPRPEYDPATTTQRQRDTAKAQELTDKGMPTSSSTVQRKRARYREEGLVGLVDHRRTRPTRPYGTTDNRVVDAIVECLIGSTTNDRPLNHQRALFRRVEARVADRYGPGTVRLPSRTTFNRLVMAVAESLRSGQTVTSRAAAHGPEGTAALPGSMVHVDTVTLNLSMSGTKGGPPVVLTVAVDAATLSIAAAIIHPYSTLPVELEALLARTLVPEEMRPTHPQMRKAAVAVQDDSATANASSAAALSRRPVIMPQALVCDRGTVYASETFLRVCAAMGIAVRNPPALSPTAGSWMELVLRQIGVQFSRYVVQQTRVVDAYTEEDRQPGPVPLCELQNLLEKWIATIWQVRPQETLRSLVPPDVSPSPNNVYAHLAALTGLVPIPLGELDYVRLLPSRWLPIHHHGVSLFRRLYDSPQLDPYRGAHSGITAQRGGWQVHYDPCDSSRVWVRDHIHDRWVDAWLSAGPEEPILADRHARRSADRTVLPNPTHTVFPGTRPPPFPFELSAPLTESEANPEKEPPMRPGPPAPLTTREGWRAFIDATLGPSTGGTGSQGQLVIATPELRRVVENGHRLIRSNQAIYGNRSLIVSGPAGSGKTVAVTQLGRVHELSVRPSSPAVGECIPVAYVAAPPAATPRMVTVEIARFLGVPVPSRANLSDMTHAVCRALHAAQCRLVIIDEFHHVFTTSLHSAPAVCAQLVHLSNQASATFVYAGIGLEWNGPFVGDAGRQVAARSTVLRMNHFSDTTSGRADWESLIASFEQSLSSRDLPSGSLVAQSRYLYRRTGGVIGSLRYLIESAAAAAAHSGTGKITRELLDEVQLDLAAESFGSDTVDPAPPRGHRG